MAHVLQHPAAGLDGAPRGLLARPVSVEAQALLWRQAGGVILGGLVGSAGLAQRIGAGLPSPADLTQPWRRVLRGGIVLVPAFAVGRAQNLLYEIFLLKRAGRMPDLPVFLDSPMAIDGM